MDHSMAIKTNEAFLKVSGTTYTLKFSNRALAQAENVYYTEYHRNVDISAIIADLIKSKLTAIMALTYGALIAGGTKITFADFDELMGKHTDEMFEIITEPILLMFGDNNSNGEGAGKN